MENKKIEKDEIIEALKNIHDPETCKHCKINEAATAPYTTMTKLKLTPLTEKVIKEIQKRTNLPKECLVCYCIGEFVKLPYPEQLERLKKQSILSN
jgi:hypothetical protein